MAKEPFLKKKKIHYVSEVSTNFTLTFNGSSDEISSMKNLKYRYESSSSSGGQELNFDKPLMVNEKVFTHKSSGKGTAIEIPDEVIQVTVQWDGNTENFEMEKIKKKK